jgi:hypothetical protein
VERSTNRPSTVGGDPEAVQKVGWKVGWKVARFALSCREFPFRAFMRLGNSRKLTETRSASSTSWGSLVRAQYRPLRNSLQTASFCFQGENAASAVVAEWSHRLSKAAISTRRDDVVTLRACSESASDSRRRDARLPRARDCAAACRARRRRRERERRLQDRGRALDTGGIALCAGARPKAGNTFAGVTFAGHSFVSGRRDRPDAAIPRRRW